MCLLIICRIIHTRALLGNGNGNYKRPSQTMKLQGKKYVPNCQRREQRAKQNCKFLVDDLYNKNMINMELRSKLDSYGGKLKG